ncbi:hypothetical protein [Rhizobium metallidurans]|uniref:BA14K family protein n=1 Tax=Rhizobium metallidurans TaxID=1265931 RepID=A0A7W6G8Y1_9HYPH|nr:hypothetical protein [Rhizobium metallidurans]MBB3962993.1 hypothetical protein [Rhizobium metallidurans]
MDTVARLTFAISSAVGACILAASVASVVMADPSQTTVMPKQDLWTSQPVRVDPLAQNYERLPPAYSTYAIEAAAGFPQASR